MEFVNMNYCRKIRIYPNKKQVELFNKCIGCSRYIYNKGIHKLKNEWIFLKEKASKEGCLKCGKELNSSLYCKKHLNLKPKINFPLTLSKLRPMLMDSDKNLNENEKWMKEIPYDTRQLVIKSLIGNIKSSISNLKNGNIKSFSMDYKTKKDIKQVFFVNKKTIQNLNIFKRRLKKKSKIRVRNRYKKYYNMKIQKDCIILKDYKYWYILIPKCKDIKYEKPTYSSCSLDPGVRTFQTMYSPDGVIGKFGDKFALKLNKINKRIDLLKSIKTKKKLNSKTKQNINSRCFILRTKIKNIVNNFQWKLSNYLSKNYNLIMLPKFETKGMSSSNKLNKKSKRMLLTLSHFKFQEKMKYQCRKFQRKLMIVNESYTSKTCTKCGNIDRKLGSSKLYNCKKCSLEIDRDINGARNIFLKNYIGQDEGL